MTESELRGKIKGLLGGRELPKKSPSEKYPQELPNDLKRATQIGTRNMIVVYGMSKKLPNISLVNKSDTGLGHAPGIERRSEYVEKIIDEETTELINLHATKKQRNC